MLIALLAVNPETSDKVTGQPWHLDVFKCASEYPCYPKSFIFPWNQTTDPADPHWGIIPQNNHKMVAETNRWNTCSAIGFPQRYFRFLPERGP